MYKSDAHGILATLPAAAPLLSGKLGEVTPLAARRSERGNHMCRECGKIFANQSSLNKHWAVHSDSRPYQCLECGKCFKRYDHLSGHLGTHRGEKPHACTVNGCCKRYSDPRSLKRHLEKHHSGDLVPGERRKKMRCESNDWAAAAVCDLAELFGNVSQTQSTQSLTEANLHNNVNNSVEGAPKTLSQPPSGNMLLPSRQFFSTPLRPVPSDMSHGNGSSPASPSTPQQIFDIAQEKPCHISSQLAHVRQSGSPWFAPHQGVLTSPGAMSRIPKQTASSNSSASLVGLCNTQDTLTNSIFRNNTMFDLTPSLHASMATPAALSDCSGPTVSTMSQSRFSLYGATGEVFPQTKQPPSLSDCSQSYVMDSTMQAEQTKHIGGMSEGLQIYPEMAQLSVQFSSAHTYSASEPSSRPSAQQINRLVQEYHLSLAQLACLPPVGLATTPPALPSQGMMNALYCANPSSNHLPMALPVGNGQTSSAQLLSRACSADEHIPCLHNTKVETFVSLPDWRSGQG